MPSFTVDIGLFPQPTGNGFIAPPTVGGNGWKLSGLGTVNVYDAMKASDAKRCITINCTGVTCASDGDHTLLYDPNKDAIILEADPPISIFSLPAGFLVQTLNVKLLLGQFAVSAGSLMKVFHNGILKATYSTTGIGAPPQYPVNGLTVVFGVVDLVPASLFVCFGSQVKVVITAAGGPNTCSINADYAGITGTYILWSTTFTITPSVGGPGTTVTLNATSGNFNEITGIEVSYIDSNTSEIIRTTATITSQTGTQIIFTIPAAVPQDSLLITGLGTGTLANNSVVLGSLNVIWGDGSGIYTLTPNKRNDTYYDRSVTPSTTKDVKIPDPFGRTSYIGG